LETSDPGSVSSEEEDSESSDDDDDDDELSQPELASFSALAPPLTPAMAVPSADTVAESEFRLEVTQSLERAFAEGHSIDNAAVELKTLRMASNVPLSRVREAVIAAVVERIKIVAGGVVPQRKEIASVVDRWGGLINKIGGVDAVETVAILQVLGFSPLCHVSLTYSIFRLIVLRLNVWLCSARYSRLYTRTTSSRRATFASGTPNPQLRVLGSGLVRRWTI
jgi:hypothetical protein